MRSFGIEDPAINAKSRAEDPLLVVEEKKEEEQSKPAGLGVHIPGEELLSEDVENPPSSTDSPAGAASMSRSGSGAAKPPVPPRRTPRIGTTSGADSPIVGAAAEKGGEEKEEEAEEEKDDAEEKKDDAEEKKDDAAPSESETEGFEDAEDGESATGSKDGEKDEKEKDEEKKDE
jgi:hypothetical protein